MILLAFAARFLILSARHIVKVVLNVTQNGSVEFRPDCKIRGEVGLEMPLKTPERLKKGILGMD
mgnify:CR=1 FL=1